MPNQITDKLQGAISGLQGMRLDPAMDLANRQKAIGLMAGLLDYLNSQPGVAGLLKDVLRDAEINFKTPSGNALDTQGWLMNKRREVLSLQSDGESVYLNLRMDKQAMGNDFFGGIDLTAQELRDDAAGGGGQEDGSHPGLGGRHPPGPGLLRRQIRDDEAVHPEGGRLPGRPLQAVLQDGIVITH